MYIHTFVGEPLAFTLFYLIFNRTAWPQMFAKVDYCTYETVPHVKP